jgi:hypothetical protein
MSLKFKVEIDYIIFNNLMEENKNVVYELSFLASNIIKKVIQGECMVQWFNIDRNYTPYKSIKYYLK